MRRTKRQLKGKKMRFRTIKRSLHKKKIYKKLGMRQRAFRGGENLSEAQINEFRETFSMFDKNGTGFIAMKDLSKVMKILGQNPMKDDLNDIIHEAGLSDKREIDFSEFLSIMTIQMKNYNAYLNMMLKPYKEFDKAGSGIISANDFRRIMISLDNSLSDKDVNDIIKVVGYPSVRPDGQIKYEDFFKKMLLLDE